MKKTILIAFFLGCLTSFASAGMKAGITGSGYQLDAVGKSSSSGGAADQSRSEDFEGATLSLFAEYSIEAARGLSIGIDVVPYDIDMGSVENKRNATAGNPNGTQGSDGQDGTTTATVDMQTPLTAYILLPTEAGLYLKAGYSMATLKISENIVTGTSYPDEDIFGYHLNVGYERDLGGAFVRAEVGHSEWDTVVVNSSSGRTSYSADLDGMSARISIGKAF